MTERLCAAINDTRHRSYITHTLHDILKKRIFQMACGYEDGNDCRTLRHDSVFRPGVGHKPFDADDVEGALASGSTANWITMARPDLSKEIVSISCPTLRIWGDTDPISPVALGVQFSHLIPQSSLSVVAGGTHNLGKDRAE